MPNYSYDAPLLRLFNDKFGLRCPRASRHRFRMNKKHFRAWPLPIGLIALGIGYAAHLEYVHAEEPWAYTAPAQRHAGTSADREELAEQLSLVYSNAQAAFIRGDAREAQQQIEEALKLAGDSPVLQRAAAQIYNNVGSYGLALELWNNLLGEYPNEAELLAERSGTLLLLGREEDAATDLRRAIRFAPANITVRYYQTLAEMRKHDTGAAARVTAGFTGEDVLSFGSRLKLERTLVEKQTYKNGYSDTAKVLLSLADGTDPAAALDRVVHQLELLRPIMGRSDWAATIPLLQEIRHAGAGYPGLYYDLALSTYLIQPTPQRLDGLEQFVLSERGAAFARYFIYLALFSQDAARAQRVADATLKDARDGEATLIRAALAYDAGRAPEAWKILENIPPAFRAASAPWFNRPIPVIQTMRSDAGYDAWLNPKL